MSAAPLAFGAAACGVAAAWELAGAVEHAALGARVGRLLAPLRRSGAARGAAEDAAVRRLLVVLAAAAGAGGLLLAGPGAGLAASAAAPWGATRLLAARRERHREELAAGAPAVARSLGDALAAGRSIRGAFATAAAAGGCGAAADAELRAAAAALELGARTEDVLERLRRRGGAPAWDTMVAAILLQRDAGGDLAGLLRAIATDLEAARRAEADARTATAQARTTARIVGVLPLLAGAVGELAAPGTLARMLSSPLPAACLACAVVLEALAMVLVRRLSRLEARP